jgi:hypothetical protein
MKTLRNLSAMPIAQKAFWALLLVAVALLIPHQASQALGMLGMGVAGMIMSVRDEFCSKTALWTAGTGLALVGNVIDSSVVRDLGSGRPVYLVILVDTAVTSAGAATVEFDLVSDAQAAIAVDGSASVHFKSTAFPKASLIAGFAAVVVALPFNGGVPYEQFLGILQNVGTAALTAGKINAFLTLDPTAYQAYPNEPNE